MTAGIIGAAGYAGAELVRLLAMHPHIDKLFLSSTTHEGKNIAEVYPNFLADIGHILRHAVLTNAETVITSSEIVFSALPHGVGEEFAHRCFYSGVPFIDISADFRFDDDGETYTAWYDKHYQYPELHEVSVYGLPEMNRHKIKAAVERAALAGNKGFDLIVANPGCYPTAATLGAMPALKLGIAGEGTIIVDAASGITGGGGENRHAHIIFLNVPIRLVLTKLAHIDTRLK